MFVVRYKASHEGKLPRWNEFEKMRQVVEKKVVATTDEILPVISFSPKRSDEDKKKREAVDTRNTFENAIYQAEKMPDEYKDKISEDDVEVIKDAVEEAKKHKDSEDKDELEADTKALNDATMAIGAKLYQEAAKEEAPASEGDEKKTDEPVEGEVVDEKKEEKK